jgi:outer membrane lipopolysaccharide assembly protein LptE/RlpB
MRLSRSILIVFLLAGLTACGFHLRGSIILPLPLISMQLIAEDLDSRQKTELERQLIRAGASLKDNQTENPVRLMVSIRVLPDYKLADTAASGKIIIRLLRELSYSLSTATGELLIDQKTILRQLDLDLDSNELAGAEYEKQSSGQLLDQELFEQLIFQLSQFQI